MKRATQYVLVGLLAVFLGSSLTYIRLNINDFTKPPKTLEPNTDKPTARLEDSMKFKTSSLKDEKTIEQSYDLTMNGIKKRITITFKLKEEKEKFEIVGNLNELNIFHYKENKSTEKLDEVFTTEHIKSLFNLDNFQLIKGLDGKSYLTVYNYENASNIRNYYIFNQDLILLNKEKNINILDGETNIVLEGGADIWYKDTSKLCKEDSPCRIKSKIEKNKIYMLIPKLEEQPTEGNYGVLEEYILMPDGDALITELISTYKIISDQLPVTQ